MAQTVSRQPLTAEARVRSPCEICGGKSGIGIRFYPSTSVFPCQYHSPSAPYSSLSTRCSYQKNKRMKSGSLSKSNALSEIGWKLGTKLLSPLVFKRLNEINVMKRGFTEVNSGRSRVFSWYLLRLMSANPIYVVEGEDLLCCNSAPCSSSLLA
jgi:hypothetical protein